MKKIISLLLLVVVALSGGMAMEAKTKSKKKSTHKSSQTTRSSYTPTEFGADVFLELDGSTSSDGEREYEIVNFRSNIGSSLQKLGFIKSGTRNNPVYTKDGIKVEMRMLSKTIPSGVSIYFNNNEERDKFINQTKALGFEWDGLECTNGWYKTTDLGAEDKFVTMSFIP